jgi:hypothetical protein
VEEEEQQEDRNRNQNIIPDFDDLVQNLLQSKKLARRALTWDTLLDELKQPVCSESTISRFSFLVKLLYLKFHHRVSNNYFDGLLKLLSDAFPKSKVPKSCEEACKCIRDLGQGYENIHVCKNNRVLFRGQLKDKDACPKCKESRWGVTGALQRKSHLEN